MEPENAISIWRGRWILTGGLLLLTLLGVGIAMIFLPRTYQATASVILLDSPSNSEATGGNPYLNFNASLTLTADAVSRQVMDPQTASSLASHGFLGSYTVEMPTYSTSTAGSVLLITVTSVQRTDTQKQALFKALVEELERQCGIDPKDVVISLVTNSRSDWSFGLGEAQFLSGKL